MDIQSSSSSVNASVNTSGKVGSLESAVTLRQEANDSVSERKEVEASDTASGVGQTVDYQA